MTDTQSNTHPPQTPNSDDRPWPVLTIDYDLFDEVLSESDASEEEKREFLDLLWNIVISFVDLGFGVHPLQQACEQPLDLSTLKFSDVVSLKEGQVSNSFNRVNAVRGGN